MRRKIEWLIWLGWSTAIICFETAFIFLDVVTKVYKTGSRIEWNASGNVFRLLYVAYTLYYARTDLANFFRMIYRRIRKKETA